MAIRCLSSSSLSSSLSSSSSPLNINNSPLSPTKSNPTNKLVMLSNATHPSSSTTIKPLFRFTKSFKNKVFEDEEKGIVCYRDYNGEIVCEGYDEGPRYQQQEPLTSTECEYYRETKIVDLLQRRLRQIVYLGVEEDASGSTSC